MEDPRLIIDLVLALGAAVIFGWMAQRIGLPVIIGYIAAGLLVGPNTPGFVADRHQAELLANVGVAFLMFALGVEFHLSELVKVRRIALITGGVQIPATIAMGLVLGMAIGWTTQASFLLGGAFAISSSIVAIKVLQGRGEMQSQHGSIVVGLSIVQDLSLVILLALLPVLSNEGGNVVIELAKSLSIAAIALATVAILGPRLMPRLIGKFAATGSSDLFLLIVIVIALGTAAAAHWAGLSFALGAFLIGIILSETEYSGQVAAKIEPIRDLFATIFFVAIGMLLDPAVVADNFGIVLVMIGVVVIGKIVVTGGALLASRVDHWTTTRASVVMGQMGEFSFVLAGAGLSAAIITDQQYGLILSAAIGSIFAMPIVLAASPRLIRIAERLPMVASRERGLIDPVVQEQSLIVPDHVVICGYGRIGSELALALGRHGVDFTVVDLNPAHVRTLRSKGIAAAWGDATEPAVLESIGISSASTVAITIPDDSATLAITRYARSRNTGIHVIARATTNHLVDAIVHAGADEVVQPEFEAGLEITRQVLNWRGVVPPAIEETIEQRREVVYRLVQDRAQAPSKEIKPPVPSMAAS